VRRLFIRHDFSMQMTRSYNNGCMASFEFDPQESAERNIEKFLYHLEQQNAEMAKLLRSNIGKMIPLPDGQKRTAARSAFNSAIKTALDKVLAKKEPSNAKVFSQTVGG